MKQQFIITIEDGEILSQIDDPLDILLKDRAAAESLFHELAEALGWSLPSKAYVPSEDAAIRRMVRDFEEPESKTAEDMSTWSAAELDEFFSTAGPDDDDVNEDEGDVVLTDPDAAAAAQQALSRRELQMKDPENANSFQPHVGSTVPPTQERGSTFGAIHLNLPPEQAY